MSSASLALRLSCDTVRTRTSAAGPDGPISAIYAGVGISFTSPVRIFHIQNLTDTILMFSYDGINDHFPLATQSFLVLDITANQAHTQGFFMAQGQRLYVRNMVAEGQNPPTIGAVYLACYVGRTS